MPVTPMTFRAITRMPPSRLAPVTASWSTPIATPVIASAVPSRRYGSHRLAVRSGSPNGLCVVITSTAAAPPRAGVPRGW